MTEPWRPDPYQHRGVEHLLSHPYAGLFDDPGLGKTSTTLAAITVLLEMKMIRSALIVAPLNALRLTWPAEIQKWTQFAHLKWQFLHGPDKAERARAPADVYLINYDGLPWLCTKLKRWRWPDMLVLDESTKLKHTSTSRHRALRPRMGHFQRCALLTGLPSPNGIGDLFGQFLLLDKGARLGTSKGRFHATYYTKDGFDWKPKPDAEERLWDAIQDISLRRSAKDHLNLPSLTVVDRPVELPAKARRQYDQLEKTFLLDLEEGRVTAANAGVLSQKLRQLSSGFVYDANGVDHPVHSAKLQETADLIEEIAKPTIVIYEWNADREELEHLFPDAHCLTGRTTRQAREIIEAWNAGRIGQLLLHPASAAHGLNLQKGGQHMIWMSPTWNLEHWVQTVARIHRRGQEHSVMIYRVVVANSPVEQRVCRGLDKKKSGQDFLLGLMEE